MLLQPNQGQAEVNRDVPKSASPSIKKDDTFKAKKLEALARFKARKAEAKVQAHKDALALRDELTREGAFEKLSDTSRAFILELCRDPSEKQTRSTSIGGAPTSSVFVQMFGATPNVGDQITLLEAMKRTTKGQSTLAVWLKRWAEKGTTVVYIPAANRSDVLEGSFYKIEALASAN